MPTIEHQLDPLSYLICDVENIDDSFDHALGTERILSARVKCCYLITYIGDMQFDVTSYFEEKHPKMLDLFKESALRRYLDQQT